MASTIQTIETPKRARALDTSGNNHHGQIYSGRALEFDGVTDYLNITETTFVDFSAETTQARKAWTVAAWVNIDALNPGWIQGIIGSSGTTSSAYVSLSTAGKMQLWDVGGAAWRSSNTALNINTWHRVAWVFDGDTTVTFYLNGVADGTGEIDNSGDNADLLVRYIGARVGGDSTPTTERLFKGKMADLQLWRGAFTADDASYDYLNPESLVLSNGGTSLTESNLLAWWPMLDGHRGQQSYVLDASNTGLGDELVTNGTFDSDISSWTDYASSFTTETHDNDRLKIVASGGTARMTQEVTGLKSGTTYKFSFDVVSRTGNNFVHLGTAAGGSQIVANLGYATAGTHTHFFTSTQTTVHIQLGTVDGTTVVYDNVSLKPVNDKNNASTTFYGDELMANGNCEVTDPTTIQIGDEPMSAADAAMDDSTEQKSGGSKSIKVTADSSSTFPAVRWLDGSDMGLVKGRTYEASCYVYLPASQTMATIELKAVDNAGSTTLATSSTSTTNAWTKLTITFTDDDISKMEIVGYASGGANVNNEYYYIDDISVKETGFASGWTDADQQLHIPQTAVQPYNELGMFLGVDDGTDSDISLGSDSDIDDIFDGGGTISAWIYPLGGGNGGTGRIFDKAKWLLYVSGETSGACYLSFKNLTDGTDQQDRTTNRDITVGDWQHVVISYNADNPGTSAVMYINGESMQITEVTDGTGTTRTSDASNDLIVGNTANGTRAFNGCITEISMWNATLTQTQVVELYNKGKALDATKHSLYNSAATNLKGYWRNNGLSSWADLSTYGNNGTVNNITETLLIAPGADSSRDSQGFLMNRSRNTSHLNFSTTTIASGIDGGGEVVRIEDPLLIATNDFSISFWAYKFRDWDGQWVISKYVDTNNRWYIKGKESNPPYLEIYAKIGGNDVLSDADTTSLDGAAYMEDWMHVTVTVDRSDTSNGIKWYINGAATSNAGVTAGQTGTSLALASDLVVGMNDDVNHDDHHFDGKIDGLLIYGDILTAAEVLQNYNATKGSHKN